MRVISQVDTFSNKDSFEGENIYFYRVRTAGLKTPSENKRFRNNIVCRLCTEGRPMTCNVNIEEMDLKSGLGM